jgi:hypothetical protein
LLASIRDVSFQNGTGFGAANMIAVAAVPEPAFGGLLLLGIGGLLYGSYRRRRTYY